MGFRMLNDDEYADLKRITRKIDNVTGKGISHYPDSLHIAPHATSNHSTEGADDTLGGVFEVKLTKTGGSNGSTSADISYTYTVATLDDVGLGTAMAPIYRFIKRAYVTYATRGLACFNSDGDVELLIAFEQYEFEDKTVVTGVTTSSITVVTGITGVGTLTCSGTSGGTVAITTTTGTVASVTGTTTATVRVLKMS